MLALVGIVQELEILCALVAFSVCSGAHSVKGRTPSSLTARLVGILALVGTVFSTVGSCLTLAFTHQVGTVGIQCWHSMEYRWHPQGQSFCRVSCCLVFILVFFSF